MPSAAADCQAGAIQRAHLAAARDRRYLPSRRTVSPHRRIMPDSNYSSELETSSRLGLTCRDGLRLAGRPQVKQAPSTLCGGSGSSFADGPAWLAFPAGVGVEGGSAEGFEPGEQFVQAPVVVDPGL